MQALWNLWMAAKGTRSKLGFIFACRRLHQAAVEGTLALTNSASPNSFVGYSRPWRVPTTIAVETVAVRGRRAPEFCCNGRLQLSVGGSGIRNQESGLTQDFAPQSWWLALHWVSVCLSSRLQLANRAGRSPGNVYDMRAFVHHASSLGSRRLL